MIDGHRERLKLATAFLTQMFKDASRHEPDSNTTIVDIQEACAWFEGRIKGEWSLEYVCDVLGRDVRSTRAAYRRIRAAGKPILMIEDRTNGAVKMRRAKVAELAASGMSTRAIARFLDVARDTIRKDRAALQIVWRHTSRQAAE